MHFLSIVKKEIRVSWTAFSRILQAFSVSALFIFSINSVSAGALISVFSSFTHPDKELHLLKL